MARVALVSYNFPEYCIRLAGAMSHGAEVLLMLPDRDAEPFLHLLDPAVEYRPFSKPRLRQPWQQLRTVGAILAQIRAFRPDVVHFQHGHLWFSPALPLLKGYPLVVTLHDARHHVGDRSARHTPQPIMDFGYRRADRVIVHGERIKQEVTERLNIPGERIHVVPLIAMGGEVEPQDGAEATTGEPVVLFFGRIWEYKGLEYLIKAEPAITAQVPEARIVIAGRGEEFEKYRRMMVHPEHFEVHNERVSDADAEKLFNRASVVALPYVEASQSGVIPVAYRHSKPVVATLVGSLPEAVEDGETGLLVPPRDERALAEAIVTLLRDDELRRRMGANGKRKIDSEGSPQAVAAATLAVYQDLLASGPVVRDVASGARDASERSVSPDVAPRHVASGLVPDVVPAAHEYPSPTRGDATSRIARATRPRSQGVDLAPGMPPAPTAVALRRFPYPFRAALAICSDIDETGSMEEFLEIQRFLNTREQTSMGEGIGLEIGNSLFFRDKGGTLSFNGADDWARGILIDLMHAGYIDCLHSYGDRATKREETLEALETLEQAGCKLDVWINHFGAPSNLSRKFEHRFGPCDGGDPATPVYHSDVTIEYGIRFAWVGAIARVIGQSPAHPSAAFSTLLDGRYPVHSLADVARETGKWLLGKRGDERYAIQYANELTRSLTLEDGKPLHEFLRYGNHPEGISLGATSRGLAYAIDLRALDQLKAVEGFSIVYTHMGKNSDSRELIHPTTRAALQGLEREHREGRVFVTTTSRLLNYHLAWSGASWSYQQADGRTDIFVDTLVDPIFGPLEPAESRLQGLTFYVPDSNRARLYLRGKEVEGIRRNPADHTGSESVTVPVIPLTFPC